jgi:hypothetical protein
MIDNYYPNPDMAYEDRYEIDSDYLYDDQDYEDEHLEYCDTMRIFAKRHGEDVATIIEAIAETMDFEPTEAYEVWKDLCSQVREGANPEDILEDLGLEPDYIFGLL